MRQKIFILKAWETKRVQDDVHLNMAVLNAIANANRPKNRKYKPLWKKRSMRAVVDKEEMKDSLKAVQEMEKAQGKSWVEKIYKANMAGGA